MIDINRLRGIAGMASFMELSCHHRIYFLEEGLSLHPGIKRQKPIYQVKRIVKEMLMNYSGKNNLPQWLIASVWTEQINGKNQVVLDMIEYRGISEGIWPGNPRVLEFNIPETPNRVCFHRKTAIIKEEEDNLRARCKSLEDYFNEHREVSDDDFPFYFAVPHILS